MPQNNDPLAAGPFSAFLTPQKPQPTYTSTAPPLTGYEGKGGIIATIGDKFLGGLSQGRAQALQKSEMDRNNMLGAINSSIEQIQNSQLPDTIKQQKLSELDDQRGHIYLSALDGDGKGKGKDKNPIQHVARQLITSLMGPGKEKQAYTPEQMQISLFQTNQLLAKAPELAAQNAEKADAPLRAIVTKYANNKDPYAMYYDPEFQKAAAANMGLTGGQGTPYLQSIQQIGQQRAKAAEYAAHAAEYESQQKLNEERAKTERAKSPEGWKERAEALKDFLTKDQYISIYETGRMPPPQRMSAKEFSLQQAYKLAKSDDPIMREWAGKVIDKYAADSELQRARAAAQRAAAESKGLGLGDKQRAYFLRVDARYDAEEQRLESQAKREGWSDDYVASRKQEIEKNRQADYNRLPSGQRGGSSSGGKGSPAPASEAEEKFNKAMDTMVQDLLKSSPAAPATGAPPDKSNGLPANLQRFRIQRGPN